MPADDIRSVGAAASARSEASLSIARHYQRYAVEHDVVTTPNACGARRSHVLTPRRARRTPPSRRSSPQNSIRPTRSAGRRSAPAASSLRPASSIGPSRPASPAASQRLAQVDARRRPPPRRGSRARRCRSRRRTRAGWRRARTRRRTPRSAASDATRIAPAHAHRPRRSARPSAGRAAVARAVDRRALVVAEQRAALQRVRRRRAPLQTGEHPVGALGREVRVRRREIEVEASRRGSAPRTPAAPRRAGTCIERRDGFHDKPITRREMETCGNLRTGFAPIKVQQLDQRMHTVRS